MKLVKASSLVALCAIATLVLLPGCKKPSFGNQLSTKQEIEIGRQASEQVQISFPVVGDESLTKPIDEIAARIIPIAKTTRGDIEYHVRVLKSDELDSFSLPGGWIYIDQGLVSKIGDDNQALACLIAHEAAHVALRHAARQLSEAYGTDSLIDMLSQGKYEEAANISLQLALLSHSHQDEQDADRLGESIAKQAGYDPAGFARFLTMIQKQPASEVAWAQTHPIGKGRVKNLDQTIKDLASAKAAAAGKQ